MSDQNTPRRGWGWPVAFGNTGTDPKTFPATFSGPPAPPAINRARQLIATAYAIVVRRQPPLVFPATLRREPVTYGGPIITDADTL